MMKSKKTRFLSLLLTAAMLLTAVIAPAAVFAADSDDGMFCLYSWDKNCSKTVDTTGNTLSFDFYAQTYWMNGAMPLRDALELGELRFDYKLTNNNTEMDLSKAHFWSFNMQLKQGGTSDFDPVTNYTGGAVKALFENTSDYKFGETYHASVPLRELANFPASMNEKNAWDFFDRMIFTTWYSDVNEAGEKVSAGTPMWGLTLSNVGIYMPENPTFISDTVTGNKVVLKWWNGKDYGKQPSNGDAVGSYVIYDGDSAVSDEMSGLTMQCVIENAPRGTHSYRLMRKENGVLTECDTLNVDVAAGEKAGTTLYKSYSIAQMYPSKDIIDSAATPADAENKPSDLPSTSVKITGKNMTSGYMQLMSSGVCKLEEIRNNGELHFYAYVDDNGEEPFDSASDGLRVALNSEGGGGNHSGNTYCGTSQVDVSLTPGRWVHNVIKLSDLAKNAIEGSEYALEDYDLVKSIRVMPKSTIPGDSGKDYDYYLAGFEFRTVDSGEPAVTESAMNMMRNFGTVNNGSYAPTADIPGTPEYIPDNSVKVTPKNVPSYTQIFNGNGGAETCWALNNLKEDGVLRFYVYLDDKGTGSYDSSAHKVNIMLDGENMQGSAPISEANENGTYGSSAQIDISPDKANTWTPVEIKFSEFTANINDTASAWRLVDYDKVRSIRVVPSWAIQHAETDFDLYLTGFEIYAPAFHVKAEEIMSGVNQLTWNAKADATHYAIYRNGEQIEANFAGLAYTDAYSADSYETVQYTVVALKKESDTWYRNLDRVSTYLTVQPEVWADDTVIFGNSISGVQLSASPDYWSALQSGAWRERRILGSGTAALWGLDTNSTQTMEGTLTSGNYDLSAKGDSYLSMQVYYDMNDMTGMPQFFAGVKTADGNLYADSELSITKQNWTQVLVKLSDIADGAALKNVEGIAIKCSSDGRGRGTVYVRNVKIVTPHVFSNLVYTDSGENEVDLLESGAAYTSSVNYINAESDAKAVKQLVAIYSNGILEKCFISDVKEIAAGAENTLTLGFTVPEGIEEPVVKTFVWSADTQKPYVIYNAE